MTPGLCFSALSFCSYGFPGGNYGFPGRSYGFPGGSYGFSGGFVKMGVGADVDVLKDLGFR